MQKRTQKTRRCLVLFTLLLFSLLCTPSEHEMEERVDDGRCVEWISSDETDDEECTSTTQVLSLSTKYGHTSVCFYKTEDSNQPLDLSMKRVTKSATEASSSSSTPEPSLSSVAKSGNLPSLSSISHSLPSSLPHSLPPSSFLSSFLSSSLSSPSSHSLSSLPLPPLPSLPPSSSPFDLTLTFHTKPKKVVMQKKGQSSVVLYLQDEKCFFLPQKHSRILLQFCGCHFVKSRSYINVKYRDYVSRLLSELDYDYIEIVEAEEAQAKSQKGNDEEKASKAKKRKHNSDGISKEKNKKKKRKYRIDYAANSLAELQRLSSAASSAIFKDMLDGKKTAQLIRVKGCVASLCLESLSREGLSVLFFSCVFSKHTYLPKTPSKHVSFSFNSLSFFGCTSAHSFLSSLYSKGGSVNKLFLFTSDSRTLIRSYPSIVHALDGQKLESLYTSHIFFTYLKLHYNPQNILHIGILVIDSLLASSIGHCLSKIDIASFEEKNSPLKEDSPLYGAPCTSSSDKSSPDRYKNVHIERTELHLVIDRKWRNLRTLYLGVETYFLVKNLHNFICATSTLVVIIESINTDLNKVVLLRDLRERKKEIEEIFASRSYTEIRYQNEILFSYCRREEGKNK